MLTDKILNYLCGFFGDSFSAANLNAAAKGIASEIGCPQDGSSYLRIQFCGLVGLIRITTAAEKNIVSMSVATQRAYRDPQGDAVCETTWLNVRASSGSNIPTETLEKITKGTVVRAEGYLRPVRYVNENGEDRTFTEVIATDLEIVNPECHD